MKLRVSLPILVLGVLLRVVVYFQNRSLFLDEANLARNIAEKSFGAFFQQLDFNQYAPPLFSSLEKGFLIAFGNNELALRLLPLIAGILSLILFYFLCKKLIASEELIWLPLFLMGFSPYFLQYATEIKQYSVDTATAMIFLFYAVKIPPEQFRARHVLLWSVGGATAIWLSMPLVFILCGIGIYYLYGFWKEGNVVKLKQISFAIGLWLFSFGAYYFLILSHDLSHVHLVEYHSPYFIPLLPKTMADFQQLGNIALSLFHTAVGYTVLAYIVGITSFIFGIYGYYKKDKSRFILLVLPLASCFLASGLHYYSLIPRLTLFFIPIILLFITKGIEVILAGAGKPVQVLVWLMLLFTFPLQEGYRYFFKKYEIEEIRQVLDYVVENKRAADVFFIHEEAVPAYVFYSRHHDRKKKYHWNNTFLASWNEEAGSLKPRLKDRARVWLIFSHVISENTRQRVAQNRKSMESWSQEIEACEVKGAACYLYEVKEVRPH